MTVTRADVVRVARSYVGVRWRHQGRTRAGIDCIGLVIAVAHDLGLTDYDFTGYGRVPDGKALRATMCEQMDLLSTEPQLGDVLLLRFDRNPLHTDPSFAADEAADAVADLSPMSRSAILRLMAKEEREDVKELLAHPEMSAGGIMTTEFIALEADLLEVEAKVPDVTA